MKWLTKRSQSEDSVDASRLPVYVGLSVIGMWAVSWWLLYDNKDRGTFGDMFGAVNALFSGLGIAYVVYAIILQRHGLELQKKDMDTRKNEMVSETYLNNTLALLERAYLILADLDQFGRPKNSRMTWLSSARLLRASENLSLLITEDVHKRIYEEHLEYWRAKFHDLLMPYDLHAAGYPPEYFAKQPEDLLAYKTGSRPPLSLKSLAYLYRFIRPDDFRDPLGDVPSFTPEEIKRMATIGPKGLGSLLVKYDELLQKNSDR